MSLRASQPLRSKVIAHTMLFEVIDQLLVVSVTMELLFIEET